MGWVSGARLTAATSAAGGLGILAAVTMTDDELRAAVRSVKERTDRPFGVNFRADQPDLRRAHRVRGRRGRAARSASPARRPRTSIARLHDAGVKVMPTVGARRHAEKMLEWGVDAVIAQGGEGGGHTGAVPTSLLLPQVVDAVGAEIPVLGAGGFHDGRGLVAALAWGADGVAMGTRFLLTQESHVPDVVKQRYLAAGVLDTVVTTALDGAPQRVVRTDLVDKLERSSIVTRFPPGARPAAASPGRPARRRGPAEGGPGDAQHQDLTLGQLAMAANAPMLIKAALVDGNPDVGVLPTGQVTGVGRRGADGGRADRADRRRGRGDARAARRLSESWTSTWSGRGRGVPRRGPGAGCERRTCRSGPEPSGDTREGFARHLDWERRSSPTAGRSCRGPRSSAGGPRRCGSG